MEESMRNFVRSVFNENPDYGSLTKGYLRKQFVEKNNISDLSNAEKQLFSSVVNELLLEFADKMENKDAGASEKSEDLKSAEKALEQNEKTAEQNESLSSEGELVINFDKSDSESSNKLNSINKSGKKLDNNTSIKDEGSFNTEKRKATSSSEKQRKKAKTLSKTASVSSSEDDFSVNPHVTKKEPETSKNIGSIIDSDGDDFSSVSKTKKRNRHKSDSSSESSSDHSEIKKKSAKLSTKKKTSNKENDPSKKKLTKAASVESSDDEVPINLPATKKSEVSKSSGFESESEDDSSFKNLSLPKKQKRQNSISSGESSADLSGSETKSEQPAKKTLSKKNASVKTSKKIKSISKSASLSSSEDESFTNTSVVEKKTAVPESANVEIDSDDDDSSDNLINTKKKNGHKSANNCESSSDLSEDDTESAEPSKKKKAPDKKTAASSGDKKSTKNSKGNAKIENLKKYFRVAGLTLLAYRKQLANCTSVKDRAEKMLKILENEGLKGKPTLEKCKKLKKKIEKRKEVENLDLSNIIETKGRPKRTAASYISLTSENKPDAETRPTTVKHFSRLKGIVDSEESDEE